MASAVQPVLDGDTLLMYDVEDDEDAVAVLQGDGGDDRPSEIKLTKAVEQLQAENGGSFCLVLYGAHRSALYNGTMEQQSITTGVLAGVRSNGASPMMQRANGACANDACDGGYCRNPSPAARSAVGARSS